MTEQTKDEKHSLQQRLESYKKLQAGVAKNKKCYEEFMATRTLTQARKVLFGIKAKQKKSKK